MYVHLAKLSKLLWILFPGDGTVYCRRFGHHYSQHHLIWGVSHRPGGLFTLLSRRHWIVTLPLTWRQ